MSEFSAAVLVSASVISGLDVINILAVILAPSLPILLGWIWKTVMGLRHRIADLEDESTRHSRTLYGDADDPTHNGLAEELSEIESTLSEMERDVAHISRTLDSDRPTEDRQHDHDGTPAPGADGDGRRDRGND
jgi:hypothetical protein